ncbi:MAG: MASE3 domain-containing protein [Methanoregulaceae archaeon]
MTPDTDIRYEVGNWAPWHGRIIHYAPVIGVLLAVAVAMFFFLNPSQYLIFHTVVELVSVIIMCTIFLLAWHTRDISDRGYFVVLGIAFLWTAVFVVLHALSFKGMALFPGDSTNLPSQLWIASRYLFAGSLLAVLFFLRRRAPAFLIFLFYLFLTADLLGMIILGIFPDCYIEGQGLTLFKIASEYVICLMLAGAAYLHYRYRTDFDPEVFRCIIGGIIVSIGAELLFTQYVSVSGFTIYLGHILLIISIYLFYRGIIFIGLTKPQILLYRDLHQARDDLERLSSYNRSLIDSSPIPIIIIAPDGTVIDINPVASTLTGRPRDQMIGMRHTTWLTEPGRAEEAFQSALAGHEIRDLSLEVIGRNGRKIPMISVAAPLRDATGKITGVIRSSIDISQRKLVEEALKLSNEKLNILSSITRHDILNQLTALMGYNDLLLEKTENPDARSLLEREAKIAGNIRHQIEFTREYQNLGMDTPEWVNVSRSFENALAALPFAGEISVGTRCRNLELYADALFEKVFYNLVDNSLRHGEEVRRISLSCTEDGDRMVVRYEDDGVGIAAQEKEKIFEKGFGKNTGLGLFLVREILSITGIEIRESGTPGVGVRFEILVPKEAWRVRADSDKGNAPD